MPSEAKGPSGIKKYNSKMLTFQSLDAEITRQLHCSRQELTPKPTKDVPVLQARAYTKAKKQVCSTAPGESLHQSPKARMLHCSRRELIPKPKNKGAPLLQARAYTYTKAKREANLRIVHCSKGELAIHNIRTHQGSYNTNRLNSSNGCRVVI